MAGSLVQHFKKNPVLDTDIGAFEYVSDLGQGGNASVLKFKRGEHDFAIKFIPHGDEGKLRRFRDEIFCAAQIPAHQRDFQNHSTAPRLHRFLPCLPHSKSG